MIVKCVKFKVTKREHSVSVLDWSIFEFFTFPVCLILPCLRASLHFPFIWPPLTEE